MTNRTAEIATASEMPKEIECKYLVARLPENLDQYPRHEITQGYLVISDEAEVRLRKSDNDFVQTVKSGSGKVRSEVEIPITEEQYQALWGMTSGKRLEKTRYKIPLDNDNFAELDVYKGDLEGLMTVEVEFKSEAQANSFIPPEWFGVDVTANKSYKNQQLATKGHPQEMVKAEKASNSSDELNISKYNLKIY